MRMLSLKAPYRFCNRGCAKPRQPNSSPKVPASTPIKLKNSEPGKNPESEGKTIQCCGGEPPKTRLSASSSRNSTAGPNTAIAHQPIPTRQVRTWPSTDRAPPPPGKSPATKSADNVGV